MARYPGRPCKVPGCPELVYKKGARYCDKYHGDLGQKERADRDLRRGSSAARGYGFRWQKIRKMQLSRFPLCADPFDRHSGPVAANEVDHIIPKVKGGKDDFENLQSLCKSCHSKKTALEDSRWG